MGREKMYFVNQADNSTVDVRERITEEEVSEIERSGLDPMSAPPGPYTVQPDRQGRLVWQTGRLGLLRGRLLPTTEEPLHIPGSDESLPGAEQPDLPGGGGQGPEEGRL